MSPTKPASPPEAPADRAVVLLVDDDPALRLLHSRFLEMGGYEVVTAEDGYTALEYLAVHEAPVAIVIDLMMPGLDGWGFLAARRKNEALTAIPVLVLSSLAGEPEIRFHLENHLDVQAALRKPVPRQVLLDTLAGLGTGSVE
jgi:CheY-like chemotaxis protein